LIHGEIFNLVFSPQLRSSRAKSGISYSLSHQNNLKTTANASNKRLVNYNYLKIGNICRGSHNVSTTLTCYHYYFLTWLAPRSRQIYFILSPHNSKQYLPIPLTLTFRDLISQAIDHLISLYHSLVQFAWTAVRLSILHRFHLLRVASKQVILISLNSRLPQTQPYCL
jgi:hypothetical protein